MPHAPNCPPGIPDATASRPWEASVLSLGTVLAYAGSLHCPFVFDDESSIATNASLHSLAHLGTVLAPSEHAGVGGRPLLNLTYALNYALGGASVEGYHLANILIHVLSALALLGVLRRSLASPRLPVAIRAAGASLAFTATLLWAWHPVQTQSVTYLSERAESLMGLFYLLVLFCFMRGVDAVAPRARALWFCGSLLSCLAGVGTKELIVTAPMAVLLIDALLVSGSPLRALRERRAFYLGLFASWIPLALLMRGLGARGVGFSQGVDPVSYLLVESRALSIYLGRALFPHTLIFDYGWFRPIDLGAAMPTLALVGSLIVLVGLLARRHPALALLGGFFFLLLSPTSSIVPIASQPIAESRLYLPLAPLMLLIALAAHALFKARGLQGLRWIALGLACLTFLRNRDYAQVRLLWEDTVAKCPDNARAHANLAKELRQSPETLPAAVREYRIALALQPSAAQTHMDLGDALLAVPGHRAEAIAHLRQAVELNPAFAPAQYDLGAALMLADGGRDEARIHLAEAIRLDPSLTQAHYDLGIVLSGNPADLPLAQAQFREALRLDPTFAPAEENLGLCLLREPSALEEALAHLENAVRLSPGSYESRYNLANVLSKIPGRESEALSHYEEVLRQAPGFAAAHNNLGNLLARMPGRLGEAIAHYERALSLDPSLQAARMNLSAARERLGAVR